MKSKEALDRLYYTTSTKYSTGIERKDAYDFLVKDLEVLELIKKWSFIQDNYKEEYGTFTQFLCNIHTIGMKEDFEKVKEWLENE